MIDNIMNLHNGIEITIWWCHW